MKHDYKVQTVLERGGGWKFDWKGEGVSRRGFESGSMFIYLFFFIFFFLLTQNARIVRLGMCERVIS